jgi:hypothetical protein
VLLAKLPGVWTPLFVGTLFSKDGHMSQGSEDKHVNVIIDVMSALYRRCLILALNRLFWNKE